MTRRTWLQALAGVPIVGRLVKAEPEPIVGADWADEPANSARLMFRRGATEMHAREVLVALATPVSPYALVLLSVDPMTKALHPQMMLEGALFTTHYLRLRVLDDTPLPITVTWSLSWEEA